MDNKRKTLSDEDAAELALGIDGFTEDYDHKDSFIKQKNLDREILQLKGAVALFKQLLCSGGVLSEQEVRDFLGIKSSKLAALESEGKLIALKIDELDFYPAFQFSQDGTLVDRFTEILGLLDVVSPVDAVQFFLIPEIEINGKSPIEVMESKGDLNIVKRLAKQFGRQVAK